MRLLLLAFLLTLAACAAPAPSRRAVELGGYEGDLAALAGEWVGAYGSTESGRHGDLFFRLTAGADSAAGHVVTIPAGTAGPPRPVILPIRFVWTADEEVEGCMAPYDDPDLHIQIETCFEGRLDDDRLDGTYESRGTEDTTPAQHGRWTARRTRR